MTQDWLDRLFDDACAEAPGVEPRNRHRMVMPGGCEAEGACWASMEGCVRTGADGGTFTLMSAIKPFLLLHLLETRGADEVDSWVDDLPSSKPYWSLEELRADGGRPRNAMINSGAMLLASKLAGDRPWKQLDAFLAWLKAFCPEVKLTTDFRCLAEVLLPGADPYNFALARELVAGRRVANARDAFETYFRLCCLAGSIQDVALLGRALACSSSPHRDRVLRTMAKCGLYEASTDWFAETGLAAKSGVSGVMFGIWPGEGCLAACGPWLDPCGNPIMPRLMLQRAAGMAPPVPVML